MGLFSFERKFDSENRLANAFDDEVAPVPENSSRFKDWSKEDFFAVQGEYDEIHKAFVKFIEEGLDVDDARVQELVRRHCHLSESFWTPGKMSYISLGRSYVEDPEERPVYDSYHPQLAEYMCKAMTYFAGRELVL